MLLPHKAVKFVTDCSWLKRLIIICNVYYLDPYLEKPKVFYEMIIDLLTCKNVSGFVASKRF